MIASSSRNADASPAVALLACLLLLSLLGGCLGTPKTAPTQFGNFSSATDRISDDVIKVYEYTYTFHEGSQKEFFIRSPQRNPSVLNYELSYLNPSDLALRKLLFSALKAYALNLKYIMSNEIDTAFEADTTQLAASLTSIKTTLLPNVTLPSGITKDSISTAANKVASWFLADRKKKIVLQSLNDITPSLIIFIDTIKRQMGTCGDATDATTYCGKQDTTNLDTHPLVNEQICNNFRELIALYADEASKAKSSSEIQAQRKLMIDYRIKRDKACKMLMSIQTALSTYDKAVTHLPDIFSENKSEEFGKYIDSLDSQLLVAEQLLSQSTL